MRAIVLLIGLLNLTSCFNVSNLPNCPGWQADYRYNDNVRIRQDGGFYSGQEGKIKGQVWMYTAKGCDVPGWRIQLTDGTEIKAGEYYIERIQ